jgi:2-polyprenyl-3-methyl-5-hydroxy-6-metoxy-1,4-benzoquinol methylase
MLGQELAHDEQLSTAERLYIRLLGVPINGLRIRARRILPNVTPRFKKILDAGCGQGIMTFEFAQRLPDSHITGYDIDQQLLERNRKIAEKIAVRNCTFEYEDLTRMDVESRFDLIVSVDNLEHIQDDQDVLRRFCRALVPEGEVLIHVPGYYRRWWFFRWAVNFDVEGHVRPGYTKEEIVQKVEQAGLHVYESYYTYGWLETVTNNISYWITGARMRHKYLYAVAFPWLLLISYFGRNSRPGKGAGVLVRARKQEPDAVPSAAGSR